jgi:hypothetical protein
VGVLGTVAVRLDQIEHLTQRVQLPLAPLHQEHLSVISEALSIAWRELLQTRHATLLAGSEPELNTLMETHLNQMLDKHHLWAQLVRCVARGKETLSFDGTHLEKRPDLSVYLTFRNPSFPLIIECKLIAAGANEARYCQEGLAKFITGEYAWGTREAFMLAYVRDGSSISVRLTPFLVASESLAPPPYLIDQLPTRIALQSLDLACSIHRRSFRYPTQGPPNDRPGPISVWHLWLTVSP